MKKIIFSLMLLFTSVVIINTTDSLAKHTESVIVTTAGELAEAINNGESQIVLNYDIHLNQALEIHHPVTLSGTGTITAFSDSRHFIIRETGALTLEGDLAIRNGGGILISGGSLTMYGGQISHSHIHGVDVRNGSFHMHGGSISYNNESGVYVSNWREGAFNLHDGTISNNNNSGVRIYRSIFNMYGGVIRDNIDDQSPNHSSGGGVRADGWSVFTMKGGEITGNSADFGGGVYLDNSNMFMYGGLISRNTAHVNGGGIAVRGRGGRFIADSTFLSIFNGEISENIAESFGGGIWMISGVFRMCDGRITENTAECGGGIYLAISHGMIREGVIQGNSAKNYGGGIYFARGFDSLSMTGGTIAGNSAYSGGGIHTNYPQLIATGSEVVFAGNTAQNSYHFGNAIGRERYPNLRWAGENSRPGTHLMNNYDISYQGRWVPALWQLYLMMIGVASVIMMISALIFYRKKKSFICGAYILLFFLSWLFIGNSSVVAAEDYVIVTNEQELREAVSQRSQLIVINHVIQLEESIEIYNVITLSGSGTITVADEIRHFVVVQNGKLTLEGDITITVADGYYDSGGGIQLRQGELHMYGGEITGNRALRAGGWHVIGGGVSIETGIFHFNGGSIHGNTAVYGGGIGMEGGRGVIFINGGEIYNNHALVNGGGISTQWGMNLVFMHGGVIRDNVADFAGGGIDSDLSDLYLLGGKIHSNIAAGHGGVHDPSFGNRVTIGHGMRIVNNYPPSFHDWEERCRITWFVIPDAYRFAALLVIAIVATWLTQKSNKKNATLKAEETSTKPELLD